MAKHAGATQEELSYVEMLGAASDSSNSTDESSSPPLDDAADNHEGAEAPPVSKTAPGKGRSGEIPSHNESRAEDGGADRDEEGDASIKKPRSPVRLAVILVLVTVVGLGALAGWFGFQEHKARQAQQQRELLVRVARQGALNLTTIDWQHADTDVKRILDSATGTFYEDFSHRSQPFMDVVKKAQSTSVGTITEAGLESESGDEAQVLVAVSVKTSNRGASEQDPRHWRMRITVQKLGGEAKVSNVAFVP
ncbi:Mce protein [Mycobacterium sp. E3251]|uniref:Mce protein n=1 Tax=unclassified Mycobacterium TaxID=2642494 RepID=UPI0007FE61A7|nr:MULTISPECIES: Mce protein [unclassified Mycobacterium]OBG90451.1 Mce protein [Mycobacterium sp. E3251]OBI35174.1 Mce protein [Mycobacterium sp. E1386]